MFHLTNGKLIIVSQVRIFVIIEFVYLCILLVWVLLWCFLLITDVFYERRIKDGVLRLKVTSLFRNNRNPKNLKCSVKARFHKNIFYVLILCIIVVLMSSILYLFLQCFRLVSVVFPNFSSYFNFRRCTAEFISTVYISASKEANLSRLFFPVTVLRRFQIIASVISTSCFFSEGFFLREVVRYSVSEDRGRASSAF